MLTNLRVKNFALIEELSINLGENLIVFSGETGSGKSILMNAISFLIGEKIDKAFVRFGADYALVEGIFSVDEKVKSVCDELGIECCDELLISRKIKADGKSETRVNGSIITVAMLKKLTRALVDIYGQHQHQTLLNEQSHIDFIDSIKRPEGLDAYQDILSQIDEINKKLCEFGGDEGKRQREIDILEFELKELNDASLSINEEEELLEKQKRFKNTQKVCEAITGATSILEGDDNFSILSGLKTSAKSLLSATLEEKEIENAYSRLESVQIELEDIKESLMSIMESYSFSEEECEMVEDRLAILKNIKRKYGGSIESAITYMDEASKKLEFLQNSDFECQKLEKQKEELTEKARLLANQISKARHENAKIFEQNMKDELSQLGMKNAQILVDFVSLNSFTKNGTDGVRFLFSANKGEPLKPLTSVISGGEMSRFMLAFKAVMGNNNGTGTMIFDEIDNGIGGEVGFFVGAKLKKIAKNSQVIVVTHLASIGVMADEHFKVFKTSSNERTVSNIVKLGENEKLLEIARLAGGISEKFAYSYAQELKQKATQICA